MGGIPKSRRCRASTCRCSGKRRRRPPSRCPALSRPPCSPCQRTSTNWWMTSSVSSSLSSGGVGRKGKGEARWQGRGDVVGGSARWEVRQRPGAGSTRLSRQHPAASADCVSARQRCAAFEIVPTTRHTAAGRRAPRQAQHPATGAHPGRCLPQSRARRTACTPPSGPSSPQSCTAWRRAPAPRWTPVRGERGCSAPVLGLVDAGRHSGQAAVVSGCWRCSRRPDDGAVQRSCAAALQDGIARTSSSSGSAWLAQRLAPPTSLQILARSFWLSVVYHLASRTLPWRLSSKTKRICSSAAGAECRRRGRGGRRRWERRRKW